MSEEKKFIIGIPRALLFHRYGTRWLLFFKELGVETLLSPPSSREILEWGTALAIDETCLSNKLYLGHASSLVGYCDAIFVPRYSNLGHSEGFCTRFEGLYDQTRNLFRGGSQRFSPTNRWLMSRELVGSVLLHKDQVDGIILLSAFPCGLDSMANELLMRKIKQVPILNLVLDAQRGMAGVETRLESFVDIIRFMEGMAV